MDAVVKTLIAAARAGGELLQRRFGNHGQVKLKSGPADFQTEAEVAVEQVIMARLRKRYPRCAMLAEEDGQTDGTDGRTFIIDPLDGTNNFVLGIPFYSVSIALLRNGHLEAGVVYNPSNRATFTATRGGGAFCDGDPLAVNRQDQLRHATLAYVCHYGGSPEMESDFPRRFFAAGIKRMLTLWSPALDFCLLASGKIEAVVHHGSKLYDFAAGKLIAREAGAKITTFAGGQETSDTNDEFLATNGTALHERLVALLGR